MRKFVVINMVTLDGVIQGPGSPKEDPEDGFQHGGWVAPFRDDVGGNFVKKELSHQTDFLLGRKTFQIWESYWPHHADFWPRINEGTKYVLSRTRTNSDWKNSTFLSSVEEIKKLKNSEGPDIQIWGSSELTHLLLKHDLVDELTLKIYPVILGEGKRWFNNSSFPTAFTLTESLSTSTGVLIAKYKRAGKVRAGTEEV